MVHGHPIPLRPAPRLTLRLVYASALTELLCQLLPPGIAGLQPGSGSHAGAWRSQDTSQMSSVEALDQDALCILRDVSGSCITPPYGRTTVRRSLKTDGVAHCECE